eukprot:comp21830_c0_seq1/m.31124 comp21830_c0_seq1/g.31124  ORF comp21830_c0_seq1/g.31124 comp21830_c0_seq1/m.31124 type:complete len:356 (-) comp21830_c0_seq1:359-1426(-)
MASTVLRVVGTVCQRQALAPACVRAASQAVSATVPAQPSMPLILRACFGSAPARLNAKPPTAEPPKGAKTEEGDEEKPTTPSDGEEAEGKVEETEEVQKPREPLDPIVLERAAKGWSLNDIIMEEIIEKNPETEEEKLKIVEHLTAWKDEIESRYEAFLDDRRNMEKDYRLGFTIEEMLYRQGITAPLNQEPMHGFNRITHIRTNEAMRVHGDIDWMTKQSFAHLSHLDVKIAADDRRPLMKPWIAPTKNQMLRFSWKTLLYPQANPAHPAARKVKLQVFVGELGLPPKAQAALIALAGPRYDAKAKELKLTCDQYPSRAQNKEYLVDVLTSLVTESLKPETQKLAAAEAQAATA